MRRLLGGSISRKILASFVGIYAATYLLTALVVFTGVRASILDAESKALSELANRKIEHLSTFLQGAAVNLRAWSKLEVMNDLVTGDIDKRIQRTLEALKRQYALTGQVYAFDAAGRLVASSAARPAGRDVRLPPSWAKDGAGPVFIGKHADPLGHGDVVAFVTPVMASFSPGLRIGRLVLAYPWRAVEATLFEGGAPVVLLRRGQPPTILAANLPDAARVLAAPAGAYVAGRSRTAPAPLGAWQVVTLRRTSDADRAVRRVALELLLLGLFLGVPVIASVRWLSRRLTRPVVELTSHVQAIAGADSLGRRVRVSSADELGTLALSFNRMSETLETAARERERFVHELESLNQTLEAKVQARTAELETANAELTRAFDELKAAQGQLVHAEKMASLGQLVAGVAHELNNPIAFIYANFPHLEDYAGQLLGLIEDMRRVPDAPEVAARLDRLAAAADLDFLREDIVKIIESGKEGAARVKEIVLSLRSFSRLDEAEFKDVLLEDGLNVTLNILHHHLKGRVTVVRDFKLNRPVACFPGQMNQVFMNILFNGIQAIDGEGTLLVATRAEGPMAVVVIEDSGAGIPADLMDKIFDPFFTTKKVGEGTGLGLSISYGIMEKHGGRISVRSQPGRTVFELRLPMTRAAKEP